MPATVLLLVGNPKGGTPLMLAAPSIAIDLPLRILVAESPTGGTRVSWNDPEFLRARHGLPEAMKAPPGAPAGLVEAALR